MRECFNEKCHFLKALVRYLGHIISEAGIEPLKDRIEAINNFGVPKNVKDVQSFLGMCAYYAKLDCT